jgi:hypothetical protein
MGPMSWLDEMEAADPAYPGDVSYPAASARAGRGLYQLHAGLADGHLNAARDLIADWYARLADHANEARPGGSGRDWQPVRDGEADARKIDLRASIPQPREHRSPEYQADVARRTCDQPKCGAGSPWLPRCPARESPE